MKKDNNPIANKIPTKLEKHGDVRIDNYHWMRLSDEQKNADNLDEQTKEVINYLNEENTDITTRKDMKKAWNIRYTAGKKIA